MTTYEVARTLFWLVAGSYVFYLAWTIRRCVASRSARRRHPVNTKRSQGAAPDVMLHRPHRAVGEAQSSTLRKAG